jgi:glycosyltransferase involved in cell wall biosynthesis
MMSGQAPRLSLAIPVFNEEAVVPELLQRVRSVLSSLPGGPHEIVFVDDGSSDQTLELLDAAAREDSRLRVVVLSRNFGHQAAFSAALAHVTGDAVVLMDGDLQDAPEAIPEFLEYYRQGYEVVYARRVRRKETLALRAAYALSYRIIASLSNITLPLDAGDFALVSRRVVNALNQLPERQRYLRGLRTWVGFRQVGLDVERHQRWAGRPKYSLGRLAQLAFDGLLAFSVAPLRAAAVIGATGVVLSMLFAIYAVYVRVFLGRSPAGFTALLVAITFLAGIQLFFMGVIGEYVGRIYEETKGRPTFIVARVIEGGSGSVVRTTVP